MPDTDYIGTKDACRLLGDIHPTTLTRWANDGHIEPVYRGESRNGAFVFRRTDIEKFAADLHELAAAPPADTLPGLEAEPAPAGDAR